MSDVALTEVTTFLLARLRQEGEPVKQIRTHASIVFLGPETVWKLKLPVKFGYLDYSTPERRLSACHLEYDLNSRTAPALYVGVRRITYAKVGLEFDGIGDLVDAIVVMRRFPSDALFETLAIRHRLTPKLITELANKIWESHSTASISTDIYGADRVERVLKINEVAFQDTGLMTEAIIRRLAEVLRAEFGAYVEILNRRAREGKVRHCHGDLTLRNICVFQGQPTPFDCLEFSEELATTDTLYDIAFPLMDLWHQRLIAEGNLLFNCYADRAGETSDLILLPFFMALRAAVRSHVAAARSSGQIGGDDWRQALQYGDCAMRILEKRPPELLAIGGFSGSGQSTLAARICGFIGKAPGARHLSTDRLRKAIFGVQPTERLPSDAYRPEVSQIVYSKLRVEAGRILASGFSVVADAVFDRVEDRLEIQSVANQLGVVFNGFWLDAPAAVEANRIASRRDDPSDATTAVLELQRRRGYGQMRWTVIDASPQPAFIVAKVLETRHSKSN